MQFYNLHLQLKKILILGHFILQFHSMINLNMLSKLNPAKNLSNVNSHRNVDIYDA